MEPEALKWATEEIFWTETPPSAPDLLVRETAIDFFSLHELCLVNWQILARNLGLTDV